MDKPQIETHLSCVSKQDAILHLKNHLVNSIYRNYIIGELEKLETIELMLKTESCTPLTIKKIAAVIGYNHEKLEKNAELIADILNADNSEDIAYAYSRYPFTKVKLHNTGKWEYGYTYPDGKYVKCSVCQEIIKCIYPMKYCPNCGTKMRGDENN